MVYIAISFKDSTYPSISDILNHIPINDFQTSPSADESGNMLRRLPLTIGSLEDRGLYIYDDGFRFVIWFGRMLSPDIIKTLMGDDFTADFSKVEFPTMFSCFLYEPSAL